MFLCCFRTSSCTLQPHGQNPLSETAHIVAHKTPASWPRQSGLRRSEGENRACFATQTRSALVWVQKNHARPSIMSINRVWGSFGLERCCPQGWKRACFVTQTRTSLVWLGRRPRQTQHHEHQPGAKIPETLGSKTVKCMPEISTGTPHPGLPLRSSPLHELVAGWKFHPC